MVCRLEACLFKPLYDREKAKVAHHLPGTVSEPLVFSSLGACTPATLRRLPRGGAAKGAKVIRPHAPEIGLQAIPKALLNPVIARSSLFRSAALVSITSVLSRSVLLLLVSRGGQKLQLIQPPRWLFLVLLRPAAMFLLMAMSLRPESDK